MKCSPSKVMHDSHCHVLKDKIYGNKIIYLLIYIGLSSIYLILSRIKMMFILERIAGFIKVLRDTHQCQIAKCLSVMAMFMTIQF